MVFSFLKIFFFFFIFIFIFYPPGCKSNRGRGLSFGKSIRLCRGGGGEVYLALCMYVYVPVWLGFCYWVSFEKLKSWFVSKFKLAFLFSIMQVYLFYVSRVKLEYYAKNLIPSVGYKKLSTLKKWHKKWTVLTFSFHFCTREQAFFYI